MFDAAVLALCVFTDGDQVNIGVRRLVALDGDTGSHIGIEVKGLSEEQVHGGVTCRNGCLQRSCKTTPVLISCIFNTEANG